MDVNLEASTGIEPVYTDLQSAASPLRQLAVSQVVASSYMIGQPFARPEKGLRGLIDIVGWGDMCQNVRDRTERKSLAT